MLANRLVQKIMTEIPDVVMNGDPDQRYPGIYSHDSLEDFMTVVFNWFGFGTSNPLIMYQMKR